MTPGQGPSSLNKASVTYVSHFPSKFKVLPALKKKLPG